VKNVGREGEKLEERAGGKMEKEGHMSDKEKKRKILKAGKREEKRDMQESK
jgi:hypothetical protein